MSEEKKSLFEILPNWKQIKTYLNYPAGYLHSVVDAWGQIRIGVVALITEMEHISGPFEKRKQVLREYFKEIKGLTEIAYEKIEEADIAIDTHEHKDKITEEKYRSYYFEYLQERMVLHYLMEKIQTVFGSPEKYSSNELTRLFKRMKIRVDLNFKRGKEILRNWINEIFDSQIAWDLEKTFENQNKLFRKTSTIEDRMRDGPVKEKARAYWKLLAKDENWVVKHKEIHLYRIGQPRDALYYLGDFTQMLSVLEKEGYLGWFWMKSLQQPQNNNKLKQPEFAEFFRDKIYLYTEKLCRDRKMDPDSILVVDIETTGTDVYRDQILELGIAKIHLPTKKIEKLVDCIVRPKSDFGVEPDAWIFSHSSLTYDAVEKAWVSMDTLLPYLQYLFYNYRVTAFNKSFDLGFLARWGLEIPHELPCLMYTMTDICKIPHDYWGVKWPSFTEAWGYYFSEELDDLHRAGPDAINEAKLTIKMIEEGVLKVDLPTPQIPNEVKTEAV